MSKILLVSGIAFIAMHQTHEIPKQAYAHEVLALKAKFGDVNVRFDIDPSLPLVESTLEAEIERLGIIYGADGDAANGKGKFYMRALSENGADFERTLERALERYQPLRDEWLEANPTATGPALGSNEVEQAQANAELEREAAEAVQALEAEKAKTAKLEAKLAKSKAGDVDAAEAKVAALRAKLLAAGIDPDADA